MELHKRIKKISKTGRKCIPLTVEAHKILLTLKARTGYSCTALMELAIREFEKQLVVKP